LNLDNLGQDGNEKRYPIGIDNLMMYELFRWYYSKHNKPILLVSGNHEAYTLPYGISPRVKLTTAAAISYNPLNRRKSVDDFIEESNDRANKENDESVNAVKAGEGPNIYDKRANDGIPADHNLTIPEAILMYGPDYPRVILSSPFSITGGMNFNSDNLNWFFHIFTPLTSFYTVYGDQCFIGLGWGNDERFLNGIYKAQGKWEAGGFLPRAQDGVSDAQLDILNQAIEQPKAQNILCSHFTYVNYDGSLPINSEGTVDFGDDYALCDYGTFEVNRSDVYTIVKDNIQYALSGHSHRSGMYQITGKNHPSVPGFLSSTWKVKGQAAGNDGKFNPGAGCRILVGASGGPIPIQNHNNELFNWGLDVPSGNYIKFSGTAEAEIGVKTATTECSKPRLAVALDFADIFISEEVKHTAFKHGVFESFESSDDELPFILKFSEKTKLTAGDVIDKVVLVLYKKDGSKSEMQGTANNVDHTNHQVTLKIDTKGFDKLLMLAVQKAYIGFLDITLKQGGTGSNVYNTSKNWVFPIEVRNRKDREIEKYRQEKMLEVALLPQENLYLINQKMEEMQTAIEKMDNEIAGFIIQRHSLFGQVPHFDFYAKISQDEYA